MTPAFQDEIQLAGWSETHTGGAKVTFWLPDAAALDVFRTLTARKGNTAGHRFACVLVEIGDDERPVQPPKVEKPKASPIGDLCRWSVIRCSEPTFWEFLNTTFPTNDTVENEAEAADTLKFVCTVGSRKEFDTDPQARARFDRLIRHPYQKWALAKGIV